jgi:hypothetical protein
MSEAQRNRDDSAERQNHGRQGAPRAVDDQHQRHQEQAE